MLALNLHYLQLRQGERIEHLLARANIGDAQQERRSLQEERAAAINLVQSSGTASAGTGATTTPTPEGATP